jgi:ribosome-associated protein
MPIMLQVTDHIAIEESELHERFVRAPGPGGQNVNKVSTAVQLRFDASASPALPEPVRKRLLRLAGKRLGSDGFVTINAHRFRTRERNREDARLRLAELIRKAAQQPKPRKKTRPTRAAKERRLACKHRRSLTKRLRGTLPREE